MRRRVREGQICMLPAVFRIVSFSVFITFESVVKVSLCEFIWDWS